MKHNFDINDTIDELLDYLELYRDIINRGVLDQNYVKQINDLITEIDSLEDMTKTGNISGYNFRDLNKKVAAVFHPDRCNVDFEKLGYSPDMYARVNGIVNDLTNLQKSGVFSSFKYNRTKQEQKNDDNTYTPKGSKGNAKGEPKKDQTSYTYKPSYDNNNYSQNTQNNYTTTGRYQDAYDDYETYFERFSKWITERANVIFSKIPSSKEDYDKIKKKWEKSISSLRLRKEALGQRLVLLKEATVTNRQHWDSDIQPDVIEKIYNSRLNYLYNEFAREDFLQKQAQAARDRRYSELSPDVQKAVDSFKKDASDYYTQYMTLLNTYNRKMANMEDFNEEAMRKQLTSMRDYYMDHYYYDGEVDKLVKGILDSDPTYKQLDKDYIAAWNKAKKRFDAFEKYRTSKKQESTRITDDISASYRQKEEDISYKTKSTTAKLDRISKRLDETETKYNQFVNRYGPSYENAPGKHR